MPRDPKPRIGRRKGDGKPLDGSRVGKPLDGRVGKPLDGRRGGKPLDGSRVVEPGDRKPSDRKPGGDPSGRRRRPQRRRQPAAVRALAESRIDTAKPAEAPLTPAEVTEMRGHLDFLARHRKELRLKVNAAEDLLLNGARPPTHRGQCMHLLGKVDLKTVEAAVSRIDDPAQVSSLLAGVVRFSTDTGVLLRYLESLTEERSRSEAAAAFGVAVGRIDFADLSAARMRRVLELIATTFDGHEREQVLFGLLQSDSFRDAFDRSSEALPDQLKDTFLPLRAVWDVVFRRAPNHLGNDVLEQGLDILLRAPERILKSYPLAIRERLLESTLRWVGHPALRDRASDTLLTSLPPDSRTFSRLAVERAADLLTRHQDQPAARLLKRVATAHADFELPQRWLKALAAPRVGRFAVEAETLPSAPTLIRGWWLDRQRPVWLWLGATDPAGRVADPDPAADLGRGVDLQRRLPIAGVLPILDHGAEGARPFVALPVIGRPFGTGPQGSRRGAAIGLALAGAQLLLALAAAGIAVPRLVPEQLVIDGDGRLPQLYLVTLDGATQLAPEDAEQQHRAAAVQWCRRWLSSSSPKGEAADSEALQALTVLEDGLALGIATLARCL